MIALRPYQSVLIDSARDAMRRGVKSLVLESPTGSGKTLLTAHMIQTAASRGIRCWFIVHRVELLRQSIATFKSVGVDFGVIAAGFSPNPTALVQICSIGSLKRRLLKIQKPGLIIYDESHHVAAKSWSDIHAANPQAFHVGLSATPERLDGKGLGSYFQEIIHGPSVAWLIENGFLSKYKIAAPPGGVNADGVHRTMGDFNKAELAVVADTPTITGNAIREYLKRANGKRAIARHVNIALSKKLAADFIASGIPARHVDGDTPRLERQDAMDSFVRGETLVLCNVDLFSEGVDVPAVECILDLRPTQSLALWLQFCGRGLRPAPGKEYAVIIDMAGNLRRHGLPCQEREWSLSGRKRFKAGQAGRSILICPKCYAAQFGRPTKCKECGYLFETGEGREVQQIDGDLVDVDLGAERAKIQKKREIWGANTLPEFMALAKKYGYKPGWAWFRYNARQQKQNAKTPTEHAKADAHISSLNLGSDG